MKVLLEKGKESKCQWKSLLEEEGQDSCLESKTPNPGRKMMKGDMKQNQEKGELGWKTATKKRREQGKLRG